MLDSGAQVSLIHQDTAEALGLKGQYVSITIAKVGGEEETIKTKRYTVAVSPFDGNKYQSTFSMKRNPINHPVLKFNNVPVANVDEHKHLGMILDSKMSFASHIQAATLKCRLGIGMIKYLSTYLQSLPKVLGTPIEQWSLFDNSEFPVKFDSY